MRRKTVLSILVTLLLVATIACLLFGNNILDTGYGLAFVYPLINGLFRTADSSFHMGMTIYLWITLALSVAGIVLTWLRKPLLAAIACVIPPLFHIVRCIIEGYQPFDFGGIALTGVFFLPLIAAVLCLVLRFKADEVDYSQYEEG